MQTHYDPRYTPSNTNYLRLLIICWAPASGVPSPLGVLPSSLVGARHFGGALAPRLIRVPGGFFGSWALYGSVPSRVSCFLRLRPVPRRQSPSGVSFVRRRGVLVVSEKLLVFLFSSRFDRAKKTKTLVCEFADRRSRRFMIYAMATQYDRRNGDAVGSK